MQKLKTNPEDGGMEPVVKPDQFHAGGAFKVTLNPKTSWILSLKKKLVVDKTKGKPDGTPRPKNHLQS